MEAGTTGQRGETCAYPWDGTFQCMVISVPDLLCLNLGNVVGLPRSMVEPGRIPVGRLIFWMAEEGQEGGENWMQPQSQFELKFQLNFLEWQEMGMIKAGETLAGVLQI